MKTKTVKKGFTTVELLFAMSIIGILSTYGIINGKKVADKAFERKATNSDFYKAAVAERDLKISEIQNIENETYTKDGIEYKTENTCASGEYGFQIAATTQSNESKEYIVQGEEGCSSDQVDGQVLYFDLCSTDTQYSMIKKGVCYVA